MDYDLQVKLVEIKNGQEFRLDNTSDLIGKEGRLVLSGTSKSSELNWFASCYEDISFVNPSVVRDDTTITVKTHLGNTFKFEIL